MATVNGTSGNDSITGTNFRDYLYGYDGDDLIYGLNSGDYYFGGDGNDTYYAGITNSSDRHIIGDDGEDEFYSGTIRPNGSGNRSASNIVYYTNSPTGIEFDATTGIGVGGHADGDYFEEIHDVFGSVFNDTITGSADRNTLYGYTGHDLIYGRDGDDALYVHSANIPSVVPTLSLAASARGILYGGSGNDTLVGYDEADTLFGGNGNDSLASDAGADALFGGSGNDIIEVTDLGNTVDGGSGIDTLKFAHSLDQTIDIAAGTASVTAGLIAAFSNIENFEGGGGSDTFIGTSADESFKNIVGLDTVFAGAGEDYVEANGSALIYGGDGNDTAWAYGFGGSIASVFGGGGDDQIWYGGLIYGGDGDDVINNDPNGVSTTYGGDGDDHVIDWYDTDTILTGAGNDVVVLDGTSTRNGDADIVNLGSGNDYILAEQRLVQGSTPPGIRELNGGSGLDFIQIGDFLNGFSGGGPPVIDFRSQENGSWLTLDTIKFRNFEAVGFWGPETATDITFGDGPDSFLGFTGYNAVEAEIWGNGGNDILEVYSGRPTILHGGPGDDVLIADGGSSTSLRTSYGDEGDDVIWGGYKHAEYGGVGTIYGGSGSDGFLFMMEDTGYEVVKDFELGVDWIGLALWGYIHHNASAFATAPLAVVDLVDTAGELSFKPKYGDVNPFNPTPEELPRYIYDKNTGELKIQFSGEAPTVFLTIDGDPNLSVSDFREISRKNSTPDSDFVSGTNLSDTISAIDGDDTIYGLFGDDVMFGDLGNDTLIGGPGNDFLDGGLGNDSIDAGTGDDRVLFDASDSPSSVNGGVGIDTLVVDGSVLPTSFDLLASSFERAERKQVDTTGQPWAEKFYAYDSQWRFVALETYFDDDSLRLEDYDAADQYNWSTIQNDFEPGGALAFNRYAYDDGSRQDISYDFDNVHTWSSNRSNFDTSGGRTFNRQNYDDGSRQDVFYDVDNLQTWSTNRSNFDTLGKQSFNRQSYDDGSWQDIFYDVADVQTWSTNRNNFNSAGERTFNRQSYDDGSRQDMFYDVGDVETWSTNRNNFDAAGERTFNRQSYDDGSRQDISYDVDDVYTWSTNRNDFNASGERTFNRQSNDDGSQQDIFYDPDDVQVWTTNRNDFNASGARSFNRQSYDDGSRQDIFYDVEDLFAWSEHRQNFDDQGNLIAEYFI